LASASADKGTDISIRVPLHGPEYTCISPRTSLSRSLMLVKPSPFFIASDFISKPHPSSQTERRTAPSAFSSRTCALCAPLCLWQLRSNSCAIRKTQRLTSFGRVVGKPLRRKSTLKFRPSENSSHRLWTVDWLTISLRGIAWYGSLPAGHYELVLLRRIDCCRGPMVESNKVTFDIVP
jgi:hypothetical protein